MALTKTVENSLTSADVNALIFKSFADRGDITAEEVYDYMTIAQGRIARLRDWKDLQTDFNIDQIVTGIFSDRVVPLDDAESQLNTVFNSTHRRIRNIHAIHCIPTADIVTGINTDRRWLRKVSTMRTWVRNVRLRADITADTPTHYIWWKHSELLVHPFPDVNTTYELFVTLYPAELTSSNSANQFELIEAEDMIVALVSSLIALRLKMEALSATWFQQYKASLESFIASDIDDGDEDMAAFRAEASLQAPTDWWTDPFSNSVNGGAEQVI